MELAAEEMLVRLVIAACGAWLLAGSVARVVRTTRMDRLLYALRTTSLALACALGVVVMAALMTMGYALGTGGSCSAPSSLPSWPDSPSRS